MLALEVNGTVLRLIRLASRKWAAMLDDNHLANVTMTGNPEWHTDADGAHSLKIREIGQLVCSVRTPDNARVIGHSTREGTALLHTSSGEVTVPFCYHTPSKEYPYYAWGGYRSIGEMPVFDVYEADASGLSSAILHHLRDALVMCAMDQKLLA